MDLQGLLDHQAKEGVQGKGAILDTRVLRVLKESEEQMGQGAYQDLQVHQDSQSSTFGGTQRRIGLHLGEHLITSCWQLDGQDRQDTLDQWVRWGDQVYLGYLETQVRQDHQAEEAKWVALDQRVFEAEQGLKEEKERKVQMG